MTGRQQLAFQTRHLKQAGNRGYFHTVWRGGTRYTSSLIVRRISPQLWVWSARVAQEAKDGSPRALAELPKEQLETMRRLGFELLGGVGAEGIAVRCEGVSMSFLKPFSAEELGRAATAFRASTFFS